MKINAILPDKGRDLRLDLFRGIANGNLSGPHPRQRHQLDHDAELRLQRRRRPLCVHFGVHGLFCLCADDARTGLHRRRTTRLTKRVWQLYVAHIILFVIYIASISYLALRFGDFEIINEFNVAGLVDHATETLRQGLILKFKPVNLNVPPSILC